MAEYIDRQAVMAELEKEVKLADDWKTAHEIANVVKYFPSVDVVEVVRCKDCKHRCFGNRFGFMCDLDTGDPYELGRNAYDDDWFCADGERKE